MKKQKMLIVPVLAWMLLFLLLPLLFIIQTSFMQRDSYGNIVAEWSFGNYIRFFDPLYIGILWDTVLVSGVTNILCLMISYPLAYYISQSPPTRQKVLLILVMIPFWINFLIRAYAWVLLLRSQGIINSLLGAAGWIDEPLQLLYTPGAVLLGMVYTLLPFMVLPIYVALEQMDRRLLEAAADLGATPFRAFWRITLPQTVNGVLSGCLLVFITSLGMFVIPDVLGGAKSSLFSNIIQNQFLGARDWPFGSALSMLLIGFSLILILLYYRAAQVEGRRERFEV